MSVRRFHHVTLTVPDVASAEDAYADVFDLDVLFREGTYDDEFGALPDGLDWPTAKAAGVAPGMTFLGDEDLAIAVAERNDDRTSDGGDHTAEYDDRTGERDDPAVLDHVALHVDADVVGEIAERARERDWTVDERETAAFLVDDAGVEWELNASDPPPATPFDELDVDP